VNLEVSYDKEFDILRMLIPGRRIATSGRVSPPLIIDFGSAEDGFDVVGFELSHASEHLTPFLELLTEQATSVENV
jgi:uncharacterized protein YuzE